MPLVVMLTEGQLSKRRCCPTAEVAAERMRWWCQLIDHCGQLLVGVLKSSMFQTRQGQVSPGILLSTGSDVVRRTVLESVHC